MKVIINLVGEGVSMQQQDKARRIKIITISAIIGILIILLGIWLISAAMRTPRNTQSSSPDSTVSSSSDKPATAAPSSTSTSSPASQYDSSSSSSDGSSSNSSSASSASSSSTPNASADTSSTNAASTGTTKSSGSSKNIPSTGPHELLISALLIGTATFLAIHNLQLAKQSQL